jgi:hypothetical protein
MHEHTFTAGAAVAAPATRPPPTGPRVSALVTAVRGGCADAGHAA